jgi:hypothetical protein
VTYRPGQLHTGADGDLLFVIAAEDGIAFVTNRGTRVPVVEAETVYAPLTLVFDREPAAEKRVRELHAEFKIYDECGHLHGEDDPGVIEIENVGLTCKDGYQYSICRTCCRDGDYQSLACVEHHDHTDCHPCPTIRALDGTGADR